MEAARHDNLELMESLLAAHAEVPHEGWAAAAWMQKAAGQLDDAEEYEWNAEHQRWVLKGTDPKTLAVLNAPPPPPMGGGMGGRVEVAGRVSYCEQRPWIQSATLRENILFGQQLDLPRYAAVLSACALEKTASRTWPSDVMCWDL